MKRILVVDDERQITRMLRTSLQSSGYEVITAADGLEAFAAFEKQPPDLIITDLSMPRMTGVELTRSVRAIAPTPILVLSVRDSDAQKVMALDEGADDYLTKPFSMPELLARVRALLRRAGEPDARPVTIEDGDFVLDSEAHTVRVRGESVHLTPKEFDLLRILLQHASRVVPHRELLRAIWGPAGEGQPEYLRVLVGQLRKKVESTDRLYVHSEPWVGYRLEPLGVPRD